MSVIPIDKDSLFVETVVQPKKEFINRDECSLYVDQLIPSLQAKGYITASADSVYTDSLHTSIYIFLEKFINGQLFMPMKHRSNGCAR
ncbi:hypothetical protein LWM68_06085 [Niabella sp. W65]|nr:hypothetical protein [Niabella sp. W65]MCH7362366.1 hypothetical protein [Niabella sp. W65]ULT38329.1 hypothetical protein KRR40_24695 [Niabella sp. I65]